MESSLDDVILKKLQEYGDSVLEGNDKKKKKSSNNKLNKSDDVSSSLHSEDGQKKRKKKKKKKDKHVVDDFIDDKNTECQDEIELSGHERRLHEMSEQLGLTEFKQQLDEGKVSGEAKKSKIKTKIEPEVVVFNSHKSTKAKEKALKSSKTESTEQNPDFNMRQARYDVQKFGIKGFEGSQKEEAMTALLIKLGAKPPKNKYVNYKDYQEDRRRQKEMQVEKRELDRRLGLKIAKSGKGKKRPRSNNDIGHIDGQIGKWKSGVLVVKKDDLKGFSKKPKLK